MNTQIESQDYDTLKQEEQDYGEQSEQGFKYVALKDMQESLMAIFKQANLDGLESDEVREVLNYSFNVVNPDDMICVEEA